VRGLAGLLLQSALLSRTVRVRRIVARYRAKQHASHPCPAASVAPLCSFRPHLRVDKRSLGDGLPYVKFGVWSLALELAGSANGRLQLFPPAAAAGMSRGAAVGDAAAGGAAATGSGVRAVRAAAAASSTTAPVPVVGAAGTLPPNADQLAERVTADVRRSLTREVSLSNPHATDVAFVLDAEGPFALDTASTHAIPHPVTRLELLHASSSSSKGGGAQGAAAAAATAAAHQTMASMFAPGVLQVTPGAAPKRIYNLPPQATITVTVRFDPEAGHSLKASAAALFFSPAVPLPPNALSATAHLTQAAATAGGKQLLAPPAPAAVATTKGGRIDSVSVLPSSSAAALNGGTTALAPASSSGGGGGVVASAMAASATHLRGDYIGRLLVTFSNGTLQEVGLRAEVLRPTLVAGARCPRSCRTPGHPSFLRCPTASLLFQNHPPPPSPLLLQPLPRPSLEPCGSGARRQRSAPSTSPTRRLSTPCGRSSTLHSPPSHAAQAPRLTGGPSV
jgi:hypothetical protein